MPYSKGPAGTAERLHAQLVKLRKGYCERCGDTRNLQCAHIIRRWYRATRTDESNAWCLCGDCHGKVDTNASVFADLVERTVGWKAVNRLEVKARKGVKAGKMFWKDEAIRLRQAIKDWNQSA